MSENHVASQFMQSLIYVPTHFTVIWYSKGEMILKGSLDLILSPLVKIQTMGKTLLGIVNKLFVFKSLLTIPSNVLPLHFKQTFHSMI